MGLTSTSTSRPPSSNVTIVDPTLATLVHGARHQLLQGPPDEEAGHPAPVPGGGNGIREWLAGLGRRGSCGGDRVSAKARADQKPFGSTHPDRVRAHGAGGGAARGDAVVRRQ